MENTVPTFRFDKRFVVGAVSDRDGDGIAVEKMPEQLSECRMTNHILVLQTVPCEPFRSTYFCWGQEIVQFFTFTPRRTQARTVDP